jgi:transcriptional regulator with XRE-family HTH domain
MKITDLKLKERREKLNLTLKEVSEKTKIRPQFISEMEKGNMSFMPLVYSISFLKTYASFLKAGGKEIQSVIDDLKADNATSQPENTPTVESEVNTEDKKNLIQLLFSKRTNFWYSSQNLFNYIIYIALAIIVIGALYFSLFYDGSEKVTKNGNHLPLTSSPVKQQAANPQEQVPATQQQAPYSNPNLITLEANAIDSVRLKMDIDGKGSQQLVLSPNTRYKWTAEKQFVFSIDKARSIELWRNGSILDPIGKKGNRLYNVKITSDDVVVPNYTPDSVSIKPKATNHHSSKPKKKSVEVPMLQLSPIQKSVEPLKKSLFDKKK